MKRRASGDLWLLHDIYGGYWQLFVLRRWWETQVAGRYLGEC